MALGRFLSLNELLVPQGSPAPNPPHARGDSCPSAQGTDTVWEQGSCAGDFNDRIIQYPRRHTPQRWRSGLEKQNIGSVSAVISSYLSGLQQFFKHLSSRSGWQGTETPPCEQCSSHTCPRSVFFWLSYNLVSDSLNLDSFR